MATGTAALGLHPASRISGSAYLHHQELSHPRDRAGPLLLPSLELPPVSTVTELKGTSAVF